MLNITIDSRESRSPVFAALRANPDVEAVVRELPCGDYLPRSDFAVERKEACDFAQSIMDRRLFSQVLRLKDGFDRVLFVLEGDPYRSQSAIEPAAIRGAISYLMTIEGVSLVTVQNAAQTADLIVTMARHLQEGLGYEVPLRVGKPKNLRDLAQFLIEGLPGVGASGAKALLAHFGSAQALFNADEKALCAAPGVGKKTAARILEVLAHLC
jgi:Fanconi anemia group M protein